MRLAVATLYLMACLGAAPPPPVPPPPIPPHDLPAARDPGWGGLLDDRDDWSQVPLGVGHLNLAEAAPEAGTGWLARVLLPVYRQPGSDLEGWIARGWWLAAAPGSRPAPLPVDCLVETSYETASWVVYEAREDGWLRFGLRPPCAGAGSAWVHRSHLGLGEAALAIELWQDLFRSDRISPLFFRDRETRHALRAGPGPDAGRVAWIGAEDTFVPLEVAGDWMRVRVAQPSDYCADPAEWKGRVLEGWTRWRGPDKGPWVWFYPRGC